MKQKAIPIVSAEVFEDCLAENPRLLHDSPLIVSGYIQNWPGYRRWQDLDYLRERLGHLSAFAKAPNFITNCNDKLVSVETDFARYLDYIRDPSRVKELYDGRWLDGSYEEFAAQPLPLYCGTLRFVHSANDATFGEFQPLVPRPIKTWNHALPYYYSLFNHLWLLVSLPGALTPLHVDNNGTIALIAQLSGRKRATLYSPNDFRHVHNPAVGYMDPENPDDTNFQTWDSAVKWTADLKQGQVLFVGTGWLHHVRTVEQSISISFDFVDRSNIASYARSPDWATVLGTRVKNKPDTFVDKLKGALTWSQVDSLPPVAIGRLVMAEILRATPSDATVPDVQRIRELYLHHLAQDALQGVT
jgi:hypothetical protein